MAKDVFISYSTHNKVIADKLCMILEEVGIDCWIAPRDIPPGAEFDVAILDAIDQSQAIVVVLTPEANVSVFVKNEVNRAFSQGKAILTFRVEDIKPAKALEFYLARHQWTDGFPPPVEERIARMARALLELLGRGSEKSPKQSEQAPHDDIKKDIDNSGVLPETIQTKIESAEGYESIGDVWSAARVYEELSAALKASGNESLVPEMNRRAKINRRAAAQIMRGD